MGEVRCVQQANAILGEGPSWDSAAGVLYWVDIRRPAILRWDPALGQTGLWPMPHPVGFAVPAADGRLAFADSKGLGFLHLESGEVERLTDPEAHLPGNRFNDGKVDRRGRVWAGTMDDGCVQPSGSLYRLDRDHSLHRMDSGFICSNGIGWSPDERTMYFTDSMLRTIWAYEFDASTGDLGRRRVFATLKPDDGYPDGLTVDNHGFVWSAIWDGWRLIRFAPDGSIDREIRMPVQRPSSCVFGGAGLGTLFVTSACVELQWKALSRGPLAGSLFAFEPGVAGLPEAHFAG
jgi:L-arabinonolactonase